MKYVLSIAIAFAIGFASGIVFAIQLDGEPPSKPLRYREVKKK